VNPESAMRANHKGTMRVYSEHGQDLASRHTPQRGGHTSEVASYVKRRMERRLDQQVRDQRSHSTRTRGTHPTASPRTLRRNLGLLQEDSPFQ
jgi:hypothetical protein